MMIELTQLRNYIINPPLQAVNLWSESAEILLIGTCGLETNYGSYVKQVGGGPALGIYQMEVATHLDCWKNYLNRSILGRNVLDVSAVSFDFISSLTPPSEPLIYNLYYATLMARVHYLRVKEPLPTATDAVGLATYYKTYYNTNMGKADLSNAVDVFKGLITKLGG
jgi:hypothetical protein